MILVISKSSGQDLEDSFRIISISKYGEVDCNSLVQTRLSMGSYVCVFVDQSTLYQVAINTVCIMSKWPLLAWVPV